MFICPFFIEWAQIEHVTIEGAFNEFLDGLVIDEVVLESSSLRLTIECQLLMLINLSRNVFGSDYNLLDLLFVCIDQRQRLILGLFLVGVDLHRLLGQDGL